MLLIYGISDDHVSLIQRVGYMETSKIRKTIRIHVLDICSYEKFLERGSAYLSVSSNL